MKLVFFAHNRRDTAFVRRVGGFLSAGVDVTSVTLRRDGEPAEPGPDWPNIDLGHVEHAKFVRRLFVYLRALATVFRHRRTVATADVIYARNLDIFLFAWLSRRLCAWRPRAILVYECLDVHEALIGQSLRARVLRFLERRVLAASSLLVISSPGFVAHHFEPIQGYRGPQHWIENKLFLGDQSVPRTPQTPRDDGARITLGWVGIIRCRETLDIFVALADRFGSDIRIRIAGLVSYFLLPDFDEQIGRFDNIEFSGPYDWPHGLADVYHDIDLVWAQELSWRGGNSDWLIPNRVYEASYFGVPSVAVAGTQTGAIVQERALGYTLDAGDVAHAVEFFESLDRDELMAHAGDLQARPAADFVLLPGDTQSLVDAMAAQTKTSA